MDVEYLDIPNCPKCGDGHRFKIKVERSIVMKMLTMSDMNERPRQVKITRLFTCPVKDQEFQASFLLTDTSWNRIKSVQIAGVADDNDEG